MEFSWKTVTKCSKEAVADPNCNKVGYVLIVYNVDITRELMFKSAAVLDARSLTLRNLHTELGLGS